MIRINEATRQIEEVTLYTIDDVAYVARSEFFDEEFTQDELWEALKEAVDSIDYMYGDATLEKCIEKELEQILEDRENGLR